MEKQSIATRNYDSKSAINILIGSNDNQNLLTSAKKHTSTVLSWPWQYFHDNNTVLEIGHNFTIVNQLVMEDVPILRIMSGFSKEMYRPCSVPDCYAYILYTVYSIVIITATCFKMEAIKTTDCTNSSMGYNLVSLPVKSI